MTSGQKTALSVLISVVLFAGISVLAFTELFSVLDSRFYEPAKISKINKKLESIATCYDEYIQTLDARFATGESAFLKNSSVASFVESRPSAADAKTRTELTGALRTETIGLLGIRVVDRNLTSVHYSTFRDDVLRENLDENLVAYRNYGDLVTDLGNAEIPMSEIAAQDTSGNLAKGAVTYYDGKDGRILFAYPFYDKYMVFRGTIIFYVNATDFERLLVKKNLVGVGAPFDFIADEGAHGFALGIPSVAHEDFVKPILAAWKENKTSAQKLFAIDGGDKNQNYWIMVTSLAGKGAFVSEIFNDEILVLPLSARVLILLCAFVTIFLIVFLVLNLRRDDMTVIRERIVTLQLGVVDEYLKRKTDLNAQTISGKRAAVTKEILESLGRRGKLHRDQVEELINRSWDELLAAMNIAPKQQQVQNATFSAESTEEIKNMLQEILSSGNIKVQAVGGASAVQPTTVVSSYSSAADTSASSSDDEDIDDLEEVEELEEVDDELEETSVDVPAADSGKTASFVNSLDALGEAAADLRTEFDEALNTDALAEAVALEAPKEMDLVQEVIDLDDGSFGEKKESAASLDDVDDVEEISLDGFEDAGDLFADDADNPLAKPKKVVHSPDELIDITEDVSADFFAVKEKKSGLLNIAKMINTIPESNEEEDEVVLNFTTGLPLFDMGGLDDEVEKTEGIEGVAETPKSGGGFLAKAMMLAGNSNSLTETKTKITSDVPLSKMETYMFDDVQENGVIKQDPDGVFSIKDKVKTDGVVQDNSFKRLVDSVLNN